MSLKSPHTEHTTAGLIALLIAAFFFIHDMIDFSMWFDEINMVENSVSLNMREFYYIERQVYTSHPPAYFLMLKGWTLIAGQSDIMLRTLSVFPMLIAAAFVYRITADFTNRAAGGIAAAVIFAANDFVIDYAHTTHNYALLVMTVAMLFFFYERWLQQPRRIYATGVIGATVFLLYTHYYGAYVIIAVNIHALILLLNRRRDYVRWFVLQAISGILFIPWLPVMVRLAGGDYDRFGDHNALLATTMPTEWHTVTLTITDLLYDGAPYYLLLLIIGVVTLLLRRDVDRRRAAQHFFLLLVVLVMSVAVTLLANMRLQSYLPRRALFVMIFAAVMIGYGLAFLPRLPRWGVLAVFLILTWNAPFPETWAGNWFFRHGIESIADRAEPGDMVWIYFNGDLETRPFNYYAEQLLPEDVYHAPQLEDTVRLANQTWMRDRLWILHARDAEVKLTDAMNARGFQKVEEESSGWYVISLYSAPPADKNYTPESAVLPDKLPMPQLFGQSIELVDYGIDKLEGSPGDVFTLWLDWQARQALPEDFGIFIHMLDDELMLRTGWDAPPSHLERYLPTSYWIPGKTIHDRHTLTIPLDTPPGRYRIKIGIYSYINPMRLSVTSPDGKPTDGLILAEIDIHQK